MIVLRSVLAVCLLACALAQTPPATRPATPVPPSGDSQGTQLAPGTRRIEIPIPAPPPKVPPETVVLRVGDIQFTAAQFDALAELLGEPYRSVAKSGGRKDFADQIAKVLVLAEEARRRKLDQTQDFRLQSRYRDNEWLAVLAQNAINDSIPIDEPALREYYEAHKAEYARLHARHILVRFEGSPAQLKAGAKDLTDAEALAKVLDISKRIKAGEDFAKVAAAESDDASSALNFGDLGWFGRGQVAPSIEEAAFRLEDGQISQPVKTPLGYHLIQVVGRDFKSFDEVKGDIALKSRPEKLQQTIDELEKSVPIDYNPAFFGSPSASPVTAK